MALSSRIALVTGASSGLGRATAERLIQQGARVLLCDITDGSSSDSDPPWWCHTHKHHSSSSANHGSSSGNLLFVPPSQNANNVVFVPTDVTSEDQVSSALDAGEEAFGRPVDTVVNCAGIGLARKTISASQESSAGISWKVHDQESFDRVLRVNLSGTFNVTRLAVERMVRAKAAAASDDPFVPDNHGVVVNTASVAAYDGQIGQVAYAASKSAVVGMTLPLARELAPHGIRCNAIAPGLFATPLLLGLPTRVRTELASHVPFPKQLGDPADFARLVQSIVENPMINGEVIRIDGGLRMPPG